MVNDYLNLKLLLLCRYTAVLRFWKFRIFELSPMESSEVWLKGFVNNI